MNDLFMVIDNGGTNIKIVLIDTNGNQIDDISFSTPRLEPQKNFREVDMDTVWLKIVDSIQHLINKTNIRTKKILGITIIGHGKGLYLLDGKGIPLRNGILSTDMRGNDILDVLSLKEPTPTMQPILVSQAPVLLKWMKLYEPENYENIGHILSAKDFIRYKLTGKIHTDYTDASSNNIMDIEEKKYDSDIFQYFDITEVFTKMPQIINTTDIAGHITKEVAELTGLKEETPVMTGMFDINASALATNVLNTDYISVTAGTWSINEYLAKQPIKKNNDILNSIFVDNDYYLIESSSATSSGNLDIILNTFMEEELNPLGSTKDSIYQIVNKKLLETDSRSTDIIYLPFLYGNNVSSKVKGSFIGLGSDVDFTKIIRAVFEGVAFSHKYHFEKLIEVKSTSTKGVRLAGGMVNSPIWTQILADVLGYPIEIVEVNEVGALGGAIALSVALNLSDNFEDATQQMSKIKKVYEPNKAETAVYNEKYEKYNQIIHSLKNI